MNAPSSDPSPDALRKIAEPLSIEALATGDHLAHLFECDFRMCVFDCSCGLTRAVRDAIEEAERLRADLLASSARVRELEAKASALEKAAAGVQIELDVHFGIDGWPSDLSNAVKRLAIDRDAMFSALTEGSR